MKNIIPVTMNGLVAIAQQMAEGAALLGNVLMPHNTQAAISADTDAAVTARQDAEDERNVLRGLKDTAETVRLQARRLATFARDILKPVLGVGYSDVWDVTGFKGSLAVPDSIDDLIILLNTLALYFTANPAYEFPAHGITAVQLQAMATSLVNARKAVNAQAAELESSMTLRDEKFVLLRKRIRGVLDELNQVLDPLDARWKAFGLNMPGADETPDAPEGLKAALIGPTAVAMKWNGAARAAYYRVFKKVHGVDNDYVAVGSPADLDFTLENLPANAIIDFAVSAVNNGGESALSEPVTVTMH